jgi:hypothetical protein
VTKPGATHSHALRVRGADGSESLCRASRCFHPAPQVGHHVVVATVDGSTFCGEILNVARWNTRRGGRVTVDEIKYHRVVRYATADEVEAFNVLSHTRNLSTNQKTLEYT